MGFKIAVCGKMASGKTTFCNIVRELHPECSILSFAGPIKEIAKEYFGMTEKDRELLIKIGQFGRSIDLDVWIKYLIKNAQTKTYVVCDDLRQHNEHAALKREGWYLVKLDISPELQKERLCRAYGPDAASHMKFNNDASETEAVGLDSSNYDVVINVNDLNIEQLRNEIIKIVEAAWTAPTRTVHGYI